MKDEITVIATDAMGADRSGKILREMGLEYTVVTSDGTNENLIALARQAESRGAKVIITFGMFAKVARQYVAIPVIMVDLTEKDVLDGLMAAAKIGRRIAIFGFQKFLKGIYYVRELLKVEIVELKTVDPDEIPEVLETLEDVDVLVGGYYQTRVAESRGIPTVLVEPRESEIRKAIEQAISYLESWENGTEYDIDAFATFASITVDMNKEIVLMNRLASEYLELSGLNAVAFSVDDVCPQFSRIADVISTGRSYLNQVAKIKNRLFLYHAEPLRSKGDVLEGVSVTFQDMGDAGNPDVSIRRKLVTQENQAVYAFDHIAGNSLSMNKAMKLALRYAGTEEPVLLYGETGTGKELFAQAIHKASRRREKPFVAINCASLPESILESELFGYVRGAFTGANREGKSGLFEYADKGTIFLDEIAETSLATQGKLLRVLQEYSIRRVGGENPIPVDVRIITATNRDLVGMVREGKFRADLYFRINVLGLRIPALRERGDDIIQLAEYFLEEYFQTNGVGYRLSEEAKKIMMNYSWPGNVRELQNMIRRVVVLSDSDVIEAEAVEDYIRENQRLSDKNPGEEENRGEESRKEDGRKEEDRKEAAGKEETRKEEPRRDDVRKEEARRDDGRKGDARENLHLKSRRRYTLDEALSLSDGNKMKAAQLLGVSRATLYRMIGRKTEGVRSE